MTREEFKIKSAQLLRPFAHEFGLEYYPVNDLATILIGNGFALRFGASYEYTDLSYWRLCGRSCWIMVYMIILRAEQAIMIPRTLYGKKAALSIRIMKFRCLLTHCGINGATF